MRQLNITEIGKARIETLSESFYQTDKPTVFLKVEITPKLIQDLVSDLDFIIKYARSGH